MSRGWWILFPGGEDNPVGHPQFLLGRVIIWIQIISIFCQCFDSIVGHSHINPGGDTLTCVSVGLRPK